ncbi:cytidine deaminase [Clostridium cagae]|uniref:Cytidine deaminase n=1 Tax=Clostridium botulinum (strain Eklund 17B / Type B) TaxID=935198 RepID=B2TPJ9_CLOBB|nr:MULTISPECIES: cytidine deaminase [Clostridium]ACD24111.1 cytidine deaminase [Clostridium botulinum B str. Eklund 17B (NRP)]MBN1039558.1 cytidine deaminase [Clostridium botulinum]MBN1046401.1 cytidine deaminase [Clostridium botulinum]MBN1053105.1 cytidine deaminase [Clostridium botulinum]MBN1056300.1 cytidine deaminase [Clostridium botulinum]
MENKELIKIALKYREKAYSPYSNFKVGAAVLFDSGKVYGGCNIENASFGATNCAERTAIFTGVAEGETKINAIAIVGSLEENTYPCGICRQVISEFGGPEVKVILAKSEEDYIETDMAEILPGTFTKVDLDKNNK